MKILQEQLDFESLNPTERAIYLGARDFCMSHKWSMTLAKAFHEELTHMYSHPLPNGKN